jgi:hypothetical protein
MFENLKWIIAAVAVVGLSIGAVIYVSRNPKPPPPDDTPSKVVPKPPPVAEEPGIKHPVPAAPTQEPLPPLDQSDAPLLNAFEGVAGAEPMDQIIRPKDLVRNFVVSVDNLTTEKLAERVRPVKPTPGKFWVSGSEDAPVLDPANFERYKPMVQILGSMDTKTLVATYTRYYPLFQEAYESLGHPPEYFNDRLIEVIDHLLATPELQGPIKLAQPNVQYEFADPAIESRSAGQKALIRMGSENAKAVKDKLRELRAELAKQPRGN